MEIGQHIPKRGTFYNSLRSFYEKDGNLNKPTQLFTGSPKVWRRPTLEPEDLHKTVKYVKENALTVFIHSIYLINLCKPPEEFNKKALGCLLWDLETGSRLGFKGVVVHCGKSLNMPIDTALHNMFLNLNEVIQNVNFNCPLLLETSSGQGSETLWKYNDFKNFYSRFTKSQYNSLKICIDTCHVFAAGHDPLKFIMNWENDFPKTLVLVHFNDSKEKCGEKKDRHETPGEGYIGCEKMKAIENWCKEGRKMDKYGMSKESIPMVME